MPSPENAPPRPVTRRLVVPDSRPRPSASPFSSGRVNLAEHTQPPRLTVVACTDLAAPSHNPTLASPLFISTSSPRAPALHCSRRVTPQTTSQHPDNPRQCPANPLDCRSAPLTCPRRPSPTLSASPAARAARTGSSWSTSVRWDAPFWRIQRAQRLFPPPRLLGGFPTSRAPPDPHPLSPGRRCLHRHRRPQLEASAQQDEGRRRNPDREAPRDYLGRSCLVRAVSSASPRAPR